VIPPDSADSGGSPPARQEEASDQHDRRLTPQQRSTAMTQFIHVCLFACLALLVLLFCAEPAFAGIGAFFSGLARRDRVIQICAPVACLGLFILMKKFGPQDR